MDNKIGFRGQTPLVCQKMCCDFLRKFFRTHQKVKTSKGPFTYDVHQKMGFLDPPSPLNHGRLP